MQQDHNLVLIRHGQSSFNRTYLDFLALRGIDPSSTTWEACFALPGFEEAVCYPQLNIDAPLSPAGLAQCQLAKQLLQDKDIDLILVSPYQRALETCQAIFGHTTIRVEVHPIVAEVFRYVCDIGHHLQQKKLAFPHFDFSHMEDSDELWYLSQLQPHHHATWNAHPGLHPALSYEEKQHHALTLLKDRVIYETPAELRQRIAQLKELLGHKAKQHKRIAIVSHYHIVRTLLAEQFEPCGEIVNPRIIPNAEPIFESLQRISQFK